MTVSVEDGGIVDVSHFSFRKACYRGGKVISWGKFYDSVRTYPLSAGNQLFCVTFWSNFVQVGIYRNNTSAVQNVIVRTPSYAYTDVVSNKYFISALTFGEDPVMNPTFVNLLESSDSPNSEFVEDYLDLCTKRRAYELASPVASTATVTELRLPYSFLSWFLMDVDHIVYNEDGTLKDGYRADNYMFSDFEN